MASRKGGGGGGGSEYLDMLLLTDLEIEESTERWHISVTCPRKSMKSRGIPAQCVRGRGRGERRVRVVVRGVRGLTDEGSFW